jgi:hypothetical protein
VVVTGGAASALTSTCSASVADRRISISTGNAPATLNVCTIPCSGGESARSAYVPGVTFVILNCPLETAVEASALPS